MLRGFYTAASGMLAQQRHQEAVSNNITNSNTPGYKADQATLRSFPEMLIQQMGSKQVPTGRGLDFPIQEPLGGLHTGVYTQELESDFSQGAVRESEFSTDLALVDGTLPDENGGLFFTVENETGDERYTRNGHFTIDGEGYLTTNQGYYLLDNTGSRIQTNTEDFTVSENGNIEAEGLNVQLNIAYTANVHDLIKEGDNLFSLDGGQTVAAEDTQADYNVMQGFLEGSTVDEMKSMSEMMKSYRNFEQNQRVLRIYDESMGKSVNEIARLG